MEQSQLRRLHEVSGTAGKELEQENARLKKIVAEQALDIDTLKDLLGKTCKLSGEAERGAVSGRRKVIRGAERRACELVGIPRCARRADRYQRRTAADEADLRARIRTLANEREAYGYRMITNLLQREGWQINVKRGHRLWIED